MARAFALVIVVMLAATMVTVWANGIYTRCESDYECGKDKYCYTVSGYCVPCTECIVYKRYNRTSYPYCAKSPLECGGCVPGFEEEIFAAGEVRHSCIVDPLSIEQPADPLIPFYALLGLVIFGLLLVGVFFCYKSYRKRERHQNVREEHTDEDLSPPAYESPRLRMSLPAVESDVRETSFVFYGEKEREPFQQARPFRDPDMPYRSVDEQEEPPNTPPHLHDDETQESTWTPPPGYGQDPPTSNPTSSNETDNNELPSSSQSAHTANMPDDSGLSDSSVGTSLGSLSQRPFEGLGSSSDGIISFQQPLTTHTRSLSDEDVSGNDRSPKRARRDSGAQSLDEGASAS